ncbi:MlaD family protein [Marinobacter persicus]|jgi:phospholipid/cholesterol/gamma-HCH transport system substrate-binding protein|uniref:Phospholipid/cholesterol/gamma-HCH transport system substrate-binding protein n=1 Tax=Marinobacter persicus TaxID=930118 RepID=A0A2S6G5C6_9GAMM|nr:MlaD family protein [Marinobacter persicus]PPK50761.1 phospholipid/cholesterol/gamma-HCH transport system substrate-binding protein [Marinobacter persicus]PPK54213.1 phospholipid/cholesterol/gamma-HCH transport system substrate-binding protein [Marinobacter persicus]PPK57349.1 phospholipid/cholesterol/gamma-HCH transport system substrate-binding protein [Marinobacter persicus]
MEPKAHHVVIGFFTLVAVAAALVFALWLEKSQTDTEWAYYRINFDHPVGGLAEGNAVLYSGVNVGTVEDLTLAPENPAHVRVLVRVDQNIPIRANTKAGLVLANITGSMSVQFTGGSPDSPVLNGSRENPPVIEAQPSTLTSLLSNSETLLTKADQLLGSANELLSEDNLENIARILENTRAASESLLQSREDLIALLEQFNAAGARTEDAASRVSGAANHAREVLGKLEPVIAGLADSVNSLQPTLERLDRLTADNEKALDTGLQGVGELGPALRELRNTLRTLNSFTRRLEQDTRGTLLGEETMKEYRE